MEQSDQLPAPLDLAPVAGAATLWQDTPLLYERLRNRLASYAPNTQRALASDWRAWRAWCAASDRKTFPPRRRTSSSMCWRTPRLSSSTIAVPCRWIAMRRDRRSVARARSQRWLASLSTLHRIAEHADPTRHAGRERGASARFSAAAMSRTRRRRFDGRMFSDALEVLGKDKLRDVRASAMIAVAYSTLARRAELIELQHRGHHVR